MAQFLSTSYGPPWGGIQGGGVTATGIDLRSSPHRYLVAVDPSVIPLGSNLRITPNPFGDPNITFLAADTGGKIKGNRLDFYDWRGRTSQFGWGSRKVDVQILSQGSLAMPARYPALQVDPGVDVQDVSPVLLSRLNNFLVQHGATGEIFSGYRAQDQPAIPYGPHARGLAVDVNVGGRPIADVFGWQDIEAFGLRSGARTSSFDPVIGRDPSHVDLMNAFGSSPMSGVQDLSSGPWTHPLDPSSPGYTVLGQDTGGGLFNFFKGLFAADLPSLWGAGTAINDTAHGITDAVNTVSSVPDFLGKITDPRFWIRVLEIVGGAAMILVGLVMLARHLGKSTVASGGA